MNDDHGSEYHDDVAPRHMAMNRVAQHSDPCRVVSRGTTLLCSFSGSATEKQRFLRGSSVDSKALEPLRLLLGRLS
jgi:hypothetical protein